MAPMASKIVSMDLIMDLILFEKNENYYQE